MPGTVPKATDPLLVSSTSTTTSKAALQADPLSHSLLVTSSPDHISSGVASTGAAQLTASSATNSSLAPTNKSAQAMAAQVGNGGSKVKSGRKSNSNKSSTKTAGGTVIESTGDKAKDAELVQFIETKGHFSLVRNFHLADAFTLMNGFCGAQSLFASARYLLTSDPKHAWTALWFPFFGAVFDLLDGKVARWRNSSSMLGQELDSLADSVSVHVLLQRH
jgi:CDP-diacylglycerol--serine O-phosphatidyltransferase